MDSILEPNQNPRILAFAYGVWLITAVLSVLVFLSGRVMVIRTYTRFFPLDAWRFQEGQGSLSLVNILISFPLAALVIVIMIGGFEYQHRYMGTADGWKTLARTLAVECGILLLATFL